MGPLKILMKLIGPGPNKYFNQKNMLTRCWGQFTYLYLLLLTFTLPYFYLLVPILTYVSLLLLALTHLCLLLLTFTYSDLLLLTLTYSHLLLLTLTYINDTSNNSITCHIDFTANAMIAHSYHISSTVHASPAPRFPFHCQAGYGKRASSALRV